MCYYKSYKKLALVILGGGGGGAPFESASANINESPYLSAISIQMSKIVCTFDKGGLGVNSPLEADNLKKTNKQNICFSLKVRFFRFMFYFFAGLLKYICLLPSS